MIPETLYAQSEGADIAYRVLGEGPRDIVLSMGFISHLDLYWELPENVEFLEHLTDLGRVIIFDKRGTGLSDRDLSGASPERWCDDLIAVMDACQSSTAVVMGWLDAGSLSLLAAALHPDRVAAVIAGESLAVGHRDRSYPFGPDPRMLRMALAAIRSGGWGRGMAVKLVAPDFAASPRHLTWLKRLESMSATPRAAARLLQMTADLDLRPYLERITAPVLLLHDVEMQRLATLESMQWLADHLPNATLRLVRGERPMTTLLPFHDVTAEIEQFLGAYRPSQSGQREVATILITDVVGSTEAAARTGDAGFRYARDAHFAAVRRSLARFGGREIKTMGDGFLVSFPVPSAALRCAAEVVGDAEAIGLTIRAGVHSGEVLRQGDDLVGIAIHVAARVSAAAQASEILFTDTVRTLVLGASLNYEPVGSTTLKGVPGEWELFRLTAKDTTRSTPPG
ncbi:adenylate/guanylate cyclase domain-containing protein [Intrasporangium sp. DVR]|uniref:adenylate/guanylate cyclase domain-containing protein n=1 Tax=Intrasporangium sp. DVR TaxID=3127867 RepID=UPI00313A6BCB